MESEMKKVTVQVELDEGSINIVVERLQELRREILFVRSLADDLRNDLRKISATVSFNS